MMKVTNSKHLSALPAAAAAAAARRTKGNAAVPVVDTIAGNSSSMRTHALRKHARTHTQVRRA